MHLKRGLIRGALIALMLTLLPVTAFSAQKITTGSACKVQMQKVTFEKKVFTCIKSGKKLVWSKGIAVKPSPKATPTSSEMKSLNLLENLENLAKNQSQIQAIAFADVQSKSASVNSVPLKINARVGPNSTLSTKNFAEYLQRANNIFKSSAQPPSLDILYYKFPDLNWASDQWQQIRKDNSSRFSGLDKCKAATFCDYGETYGGDKDSGLIVVADGGVSPEFLGVTEIHEYTHVVQFHLVNNRIDLAPLWWTEGQGMFFGVAGASANLNAYSGLQRIQFSLYRSVRSLIFTESSITDGLLNEKNDPTQNMTVFGYSVGQKFVEALVALKGADQNMKVWEFMANGKTFKEAFYLTYGFTLEEAVKKIAPILASQLKQR
jgi:hypothetical protein